jgi:hypothetical protein
MTLPFPPSSISLSLGPIDSYFPPNPAALIRAIQDGMAHGVCDGSHMPTAYLSVSAAAWTIEDPVTCQAMGGTTPTSGWGTDVDSYHSELQGLHAMFLGLFAFCTFHTIMEGQVTLGCDNFNCIQRACGDWLKVSPQAAHADLIRAICVLRNKLPIRVVLQHVHGHQDTLVFFNNLDRLAQLNVHMESCAKDCLHHLLSQDVPPCSPDGIAYEGWQCYVRGNKVTSNPAQAIRHAVLALTSALHWLITTGSHTMDSMPSTGMPSSVLQTFSLHFTASG